MSVRQEGRILDGASALSVSPERRRIYELDLLRLVAALSVVAYHYTFRGQAEGDYIPVQYPGALTAVTRYGVFGVELFFLISGFVILRSARNRTAGRFVSSRIIRLYPAYWAMVIVTFTAIMATGSSDRFDLSLPVFAVNITMLQRFTPFTAVDIDGSYWTLAVELAFYGLVWLAMATRQTDRLRLWMTVWLGLAAAAELHPLWVTRTFLISNWAPFFVAGACCFLISEGDRRRSTWALLSAAGGFGAKEAGDHALAVSEVLGENLDPAVAGAGSLALLGLVLAIAMGWTARLGRPWMVTAGAITYPLYLVHQNVGYLLFDRLSLSRWPALAVVVGLVTAVAWLVHRALERPGQELLRAALALRRNPAAPAAPRRTVTPS